MHEPGLQCEEEGGEILHRPHHRRDHVRGPAHASQPPVAAPSRSASPSGIIPRPPKHPTPIDKLLASCKRLHGRRRRGEAAELLLTAAGFDGEQWSSSRHCAMARG